MKAVGYCSCGKLWENPDTGLCATCSKLERKVDTLPMIEDKEPIKKVSERMCKLLRQYGPLRKRFLFRRWCAYHGKPCIPTTVHHSCGKGEGFIDEYARERGIPAMLDVRFFVPLCLEAHTFIETHPKYAKENGYSEDRLSVK